MNISPLEYKRAFDLYLRKGVPIDLTLKQAKTTTHYIWRTRRDRKVRSSHAANDGKIFAYPIAGKWRSAMVATVFKNPANSRYR